MRYPTVGALSLASATHVETVFGKEELEWRRGGVQSERMEWQAGPDRLVGSMSCGQRRGCRVRQQEAGCDGVDEVR